MTEEKTFSKPLTEEEIHEEEIRTRISRPYYTHRVYLADVDDHDGAEMAKVIAQERYVDLELEEEYRLEAEEDERLRKEREGEKEAESDKDKKKGAKRKSMKKSMQRGSVKKGSIKRGSMKKGSIKRGSMKSGSMKRGSMKRGSMKKRGSVKRGSMKSGPTGAKRPSKAGRKSLKIQASLKRDSKKRGSSVKSPRKMTFAKGKRKLKGEDEEIEEEMDLDSMWPRHLLYRPGYTKEYELPKDYTNLWIDEGKEKAARYPELRLPDNHRGVLEKFWEHVVVVPRVKRTSAPPPTHRYELPEIKPNVTKVVNEFRKELKQNEKIKEALAYQDKNLIKRKPFYEVFATQAAKNSALVKKLVNIPPKSTLDFEDIYSCMTLIFDIHDKPDMIEPAKALLERLLQQLASMPREKRLGLQSFYGIHSFIVISTLLTWAGTKIPQEEIREEYFPRRIPDPRYKQHYDFENFLYDMAFKYRDVIKILIIGVGVVYGRGEGVLRQYFANEFKNIPIFQPGDNKVQMIHVEDLARLCLFLTKNWPEYTRYVVAAESRPYAQEDVVKTIASVMPYSSAVGIPKCFGKAFGFSSDSLNIMKANIDVSPTYLHKIIKYQLKFDFKGHISDSFVTYRKIIGRLPLRILLYGPTTVKQKQVGLTLAKYYNISYFSPFQIIKLFLKLLQRLQDFVLSSTMPTPAEAAPSSDQEGHIRNFSWEKIQENKIQFLKILQLLNVPSIELTSLVDHKDRPHKLEDILSPDNDPRDQLASQIGISDSPHGEIRSILSKFAELKTSRSLLTSLLKREVQAVIMNELLQCSSVKNDGYVMDGFPTTGKECDAVFSDSNNSTSFAPSDTSTVNKNDSYNDIPQWIFSLLIDTETALRSNLNAKTDIDFQNGPMNYFRSVQTHKLATLSAVTSVDIFENIFKVPNFSLSLQVDTAENVTAQIIRIISGKVNTGWLNECTAAIQARLKPKREHGKVKLSEGPKPKKLLRYDPFYFNYLTKMLSKQCVKVLIELPKVKPDDVNDWISKVFLENNNEARMPYRWLGLNPEDPEPDDKYPYDVEKKDLRYIKHLQ